MFAIFGLQEGFFQLSKTCLLIGQTLLFLCIYRSSNEVLKLSPSALTYGFTIWIMWKQRMKKTKTTSAHSSMLLLRHVEWNFG